MLPLVPPPVTIQSPTLASSSSPAQPPLPLTPQQNLPTTPEKVCDVSTLATNRQRGQAADDSDLENNSANPKMPAAKASWWTRYSGYQKIRALPPNSRTRRIALYAAAVAIIAIVLILVWLYRSGHLDHFFAPSISVSVKLAQGTYVGEVVAKSNIYPRALEAYRGIPYAQTTGGDNRFRPPQPIVDLQPNHLFDAVKYGYTCPQMNFPSWQAEDCLNLNLFKPYYRDDDAAAAADMAKLGGTDKKLPVVIYVHGGGFNGGQGKERNMASFVAFAETPIIGISFNYRVGALGFLPSSLSEKAGVLNLGLKDQQMLFSWVQKNVDKFGGDPDNVTIMGLSAGAHSIGHHLISYAPANKLTADPVPFHKSIIESGGSTARATFAPSHPLHEEQFQLFLTLCGLKNASEETIFSELRALPIRTVVSASWAIWRKYNKSLRWPFQPSIEGPGGVVPDLPIQSWKKGNVLRIPIMTGFDTNEGAVFVPARASQPTAVRSLMRAIIPALNETDLNTLDNMYPDPTNTAAGRNMYIESPPAGLGKQFWRLDDVYAHYAYICPVLQTAHLATTSTSNAPVYVYHFAARSALHGGTDHSDESPVVVHDMQVMKNYPGLLATAEAMTGFWTRFAVFGDPNPISPKTASDSPDGTIWSRFISPFSNETGDSGGSDLEKGRLVLFGDGNDERMGSRGRMNFGVPAQMISLTDREKDECQWWWDRVVFSEGFGNGSLTFGNSAKAKRIT